MIWKDIRNSSNLKTFGLTGQNGVVKPPASNVVMHRKLNWTDHDIFFQEIIFLLKFMRLVVAQFGWNFPVLKFAFVIVIISFWIWSALNLYSRNFSIDNKVIVYMTCSWISFIRRFICRISLKGFLCLLISCLYFMTSTLRCTRVENSGWGKGCFSKYSKRFEFAKTKRHSAAKQRADLKLL